MAELKKDFEGKGFMPEAAKENVGHHENYGRIFAGWKGYI